MAKQNRVLDMLWRDQIAADLLGGEPLAKTSGGYMVETLRRNFDGWVYVGQDSLVFIADEPIFERGLGGPHAERVLHVTYAEAGKATITAPFLFPNAIVNFDNGLELMGQKRHMKALHKTANAINGR